MRHRIAFLSLVVVALLFGCAVAPASGDRTWISLQHIGVQDTAIPIIYISPGSFVGKIRPFRRYIELPPDVYDQVETLTNEEACPTRPPKEVGDWGLTRITKLYRGRVIHVCDLERAEMCSYMADAAHLIRSNATQPVESVRSLDDYANIFRCARGFQSPS